MNSVIESDLKPNYNFWKAFGCIFVVDFEGALAQMDFTEFSNSFIDFYPILFI
jgi:hypothetical protein